MPPQVRESFEKAGIKPNDAVKIITLACQEVSVETLYHGPIPPPHILRDLKEIGVLEDVMHNFRATSDAQNAERMANVAAVKTHARCQEKLTNSRTFNENFSNIKHLLVILLVLGILFFMLYQGIELVKQKNFVWGSIFSGVSIFTVLIAVIGSVSNRQNQNKK